MTIKRLTIILFLIGIVAAVAVVPLHKMGLLSDQFAISIWLIAVRIVVVASVTLAAITGFQSPIKESGGT